jgi:hypothetical protein
VRAKDLLDMAMGIDGLELTGESDRAIRVSLGILLRGFKDRVFGDLRVKSVGASHRAGLWKIEKVADDKGESTNLDESLQAGARKNRREKTSASRHRDAPDSLDSSQAFAPHDSPPDDPDADGDVLEGTYVPFPPAPNMSADERADDNDGWWEQVIETTGMVSPDVDDEPPRDETYADAMVKHGDDYEEDTIA